MHQAEIGDHKGEAEGHEHLRQLLPRETAQQEALDAAPHHRHDGGARERCEPEAQAHAHGNLKKRVVAFGLKGTRTIDALPREHMHAVELAATC